MIIFDANVLITLSAGDENDELYEKVSGLVEDLSKNRVVIGLPAPALAEFLCGTNNATSEMITTLKRRSTIRILPFDEVSALETAWINRAAIASGRKKGASKAHWQEIKIDRQILAIARQHGAQVIYTEDSEMIAEATRLGIETVRPSSLALKPKQNGFNFEADAIDNEQEETPDFDTPVSAAPYPAPLPRGQSS